MNLKNRSRNYFKFFIYLVVVVLLNVVGLTLFMRIDLTEDKVYSLSEASKRVVSSLSEPLTINVFFTKNLPAPYNNTERYIRDLLEEYSIYANQYFNYRFYDVSPKEGDISHKSIENRELAENYGIYPVQIRILEKDEMKFQRAYMGLVLIHGDVIERLPAIMTTAGLEYQLTMAIRKLNNKISALLSLPEKIRVKLFLSSSLRSIAPLINLTGLSELPERLEKITENLNSKNFGKLEFEYIDPSKETGLQDEPIKYNILNLEWPAIPDENIKPGKGSIGLAMEYGSKFSTIPLVHVFRIPGIGTQYEMADIDKMEDIINENVESLIDINEDLGFLAEHDTYNLIHPPPERQYEDEVSNLRNLISQSYTGKYVYPKDGKIPGSFECLVVARPKKPFTDYELFQIDQFLMQGKSLCLFLETFNVIRPDNRGDIYAPEQDPIYLPLNTGLEKLLSHYGVRVKKSYALDKNCFKQDLPERLGGGEHPVYYAPIIKKEFINTDLEFMKNIKGLATIKISPLELDNERIRENGLKAYPVFSSSEKSWEMSGQINLNPFFIKPPESEDSMRSLPLAYILEGSFPSYFEGKTVPEKKPEAEDPPKADKNIEDQKKPEKLSSEDVSSDMKQTQIEGSGEFISKGKPGKLFIVACSEILMDSIVDKNGRSPNAIFIMNTIDFLNNREEIAVMRSKKQGFNPLGDTTAGIKTFVKAFNIAGLPLLVVIFGLLNMYRRLARKKHIQMMFKK